MTMAPLDPDKLRLLLEVAQWGSLSRAALAGHTSQPHVSKVIAQLEHDWGARLFRRTGRGMVLTDFGQTVVPRIRAWLDGTQRLADDFRTLAGTTAGQVRLASLPSFSSPAMALLFSRVRERHPAIRLSFLEGHIDQIEAWLHGGQADLGVTLRYGDTPRKDDEPLADFPLLLCGAPGDPRLAAGSLPFAALDGLPLVVYTRPGLMHRHLVGLFAERGMTLNTVLEANSVNVLRDVAATGTAYALLSPLAVESERRTGRLSTTRIVSPEVVLHLDLAISRSGPITGATRCVMALLRETVQTVYADSHHHAPAADMSGRG
ncbi:MAG: LysR family transcriptional regulator [Xenophilus sp.]